MGTEGPKLVERHNDPLGGFEDRWMVDPPGMDDWFRVTKCQWDDDLTVRTIWEFELANCPNPRCDGDGNVPGGAKGDLAKLSATAAIAAALF